MIVITDKTKCSGCSACASKCPVNAIIMEEDEKGFKYPTVNEEKCIKCGICENACPIINNKLIKNEPQAYACINLNEEIRKQSSSGGIFTLLAEYIIKNNGVVFGAAFTEDFMLKHICINNVNDLNKLRGSKYFQSSIENTYKKAKELLEEGKNVLFTGTPCQIEGLLSFLGKEYDNLYTQDIICHGVPSAKVWKKYLEYRKKKDNDIPSKISFRNKDNGWAAYSVKFQYKDKFYSKTKSEDCFMQAFLKNVCLRDSCYNCSFKKLNRISDITLGDFWGINNICPEMNDNKGTSLVIINSGKGEKIFDSIKEKIKYVKVDINESIKYNASMISSVAMPKDREKFFQNIEKMDFAKIVKKYTYTPGIITRIIKKIKRCLKLKK